MKPAITNHLRQQATELIERYEDEAMRKTVHDYLVRGVPRNRVLNLTIRPGLLAEAVKSGRTREQVALAVFLQMAREAGVPVAKANNIRIKLDGDVLSVKRGETKRRRKPRKGAKR